MTIEKIRIWLIRKAFTFVTPNIDYSIRRGDIVVSRDHVPGHSQLEVLDVNWALRAAAVRRIDFGCSTVVPVWSIRKMEP